jgi:hypothetical protein
MVQDVKDRIEPKCQQVAGNIVTCVALVDAATDEIDRGHLDGGNEISVDEEDTEADFGDVVQATAKDAVVTRQQPGDEQSQCHLLGYLNVRRAFKLHQPRPNAEARHCGQGWPPALHQEECLRLVVRKDHAQQIHGQEITREVQWPQLPATPDVGRKNEQRNNEPIQAGRSAVHPRRKASNISSVHSGAL